MSQLQICKYIKFTLYYTMYFVFMVTSKIYFSTDFSQMILWIALWVLNASCAAPKSLRKMHLIFVTSLQNSVQLSTSMQLQSLSKEDIKITVFFQYHSNAHSGTPDK